jgi:hypothetical protein
LLGFVHAADLKGAEAAAMQQFSLRSGQRGQLVVQEAGN